MARPDSSQRLAKVRDFGVAAHIDAGKTTLTERILFYTGQSHKIGEVHDGTTQTDYLEEERARGITITAAVTSCKWKGHSLRLIDTPGHVDFTIEVERSMRVLDGVIMVVDGVKGVEPQTETVWRQATRYRVPRLVFINKMDRPGADFEKAVKSLETRLHARPVVVAVPTELQGQVGVLDLLEARWLTFTGERGSEVVSSEVPAGLQETFDLWLERLHESVGDLDDALAELYLGGEPLPADAIRAVLRRETMKSHIQVVLGGAALRDYGVQPVLDAVIAFLPSPLEAVEPVGEHPKTHEPVPVPLTEQGPLAALAFKVQMFSGRRHIFLRIYRGRLVSGASVWNPSRNEFERVGRLFDVHADRRDALESASAGDIVLVAGLKNVTTGDTLCTPDNPVILEPIRPYEPVMALAVESVRSTDEDKVLDALNKMVEEDPTLRLVEDADSGQRLLRGMGELHLQVVLERMQREYSVEVRTGRPRVVYREGVAIPGLGEGVVDRLLEKGGRQRARVEIKVVPTGYDQVVRSFADLPAIKVTPPELTLSEQQRLWILDTVRQESYTGPLQGYPLVGADVHVVGVDLYGSESNEVALREAAARGTRAALQAADAHLLTPIMFLEVEAPSDTIGAVLGDLQSRGGLIQDMSADDSLTKVDSECAMERLFGYVNDLRSITQGRGTFTLRFSRLDRA